MTPCERCGHESLSRSQRELLILLATTGGSDAQLARGLHKAPKTVKAQLASMYRRLGVASRGEAIVLAWQTGLVTRQSKDPSPESEGSEPGPQRGRRYVFTTEPSSAEDTLLVGSR